MTDMVMEIRDKFIGNSGHKACLNTQNAWAKYVRNRWPESTVKHVMAEWGLTDGQARGLVYAQASQATIDAILDHRRGGMGLALQITELRFRRALYDHLQDERRRDELAAERARDKLARISEMAALAAPSDAAVARDGAGGGDVSSSPSPDEHDR